MCDSNYYDDRINLLEKWLNRKEAEWKARIIMPTEQMKKTDKELFQLTERSWKAARENLVAKLLNHDQFGTSIGEKKYSELTSLELSTISKNLAVRLYMFNYEYPTFLTEMIKGVIEHPSILHSDRVHLETFCKMFELDWRGDKTFKNKEEFLSRRPIYLKGDNFKAYADLDQEGLRKMIKKSCTPYVEDVVEKFS